MTGINTLILTHSDWYQHPDIETYWMVLLNVDNVYEYLLIYDMNKYE